MDTLEKHIENEVKDLGGFDPNYKKWAKNYADGLRDKIADVFFKIKDAIRHNDEDEKELSLKK